jgi:hypothetical protein
MHRILVENARRKRGGQRSRADPDEIPLAAAEPSENLLTLDEALTRPAAADLVQRPVPVAGGASGRHRCPAVTSLQGISYATGPAYRGLKWALLAEFRNRQRVASL